MDLLRLIAVHVLVGTSVALGMAIIPAAVWLAARVVHGGARKTPGRLARG